MTQQDKYFQFPVRLLQKPWADSGELSQFIVDLAIGHLTANSLPSEIDEVMPHLVERYTDRHGLIPDSDYEPDTDHEFYMAAAEFLNVNLNQKNIEAVAVRIKGRSEQYPSTGTLCRLRTDILWSMNDGWHMNKSRTLIAVYAGIGQNQSQWLSYSRIQALSAGYSGVTEANAFSGARLPSVKTVRYWLDKLWQQNLFQMVLVGNTKRVYSNKFPDDAALKAHIQKTKRLKKRLERL